MSHILIVGAGIVGLACARALQADGRRLTIVDRDPAGDKASFGNAGGLAVTEIIPASVPGVAWKVPGWLFDPLGPLSLSVRHLPALSPWLMRFLRAGTWPEVERISSALAALLGCTYHDMAPLLAELGLAGDLQRVGALWAYESRAGFDADTPFHDIRRRHGIVCDEISGQEAREVEPALGDAVRHAVFTPQWSHVSDPKGIVDRLRGQVVAHGATIVTGEVKAIDGATLTLLDGALLSFDRLVVAAGAWSARVARLVGDRAVLESERGYNVTLPNAGVTLGREVIFAERSFVATPLREGLRIGGAAEFAGLETPPNYARSDALARLATRYLPGLDLAGGTRWMGHRPTTPDSLPVISRSPRREDIFYAFGHGHAGLTLAPTTGRLIADLVAGRAPPIDLAPYSIRRFS